MYCILCILWCILWASGPEINVILSYLILSYLVHHAQACIGSTRDQRDPLQLAEHSGDPAGVVPAIADVPGRATLHHLKFLRIVMCI